MRPHTTLYSKPTPFAIENLAIGFVQKVVVLEGVKHYDLYHDFAFDWVMTYAIEWFDYCLRDKREWGKMLDLEPTL